MRTKSGQLPVYSDFKNGRTKQTTILRRVRGDVVCLENELSNAVNQAIKLDSDDPYRVISDYLRQFAKETDDDDAE